MTVKIISYITPNLLVTHVEDNVVVVQFFRVLIENSLISCLGTMILFRNLEFAQIYCLAN